MSVVNVFRLSNLLYCPTIKVKVILKFDILLTIAGYMSCKLRICKIFSNWKAGSFFSIPSKSGCWRSNFHSRKRCPPKDEKYKQIASSFWKFNKANTKWHKGNQASTLEVWARALVHLAYRRRGSLWHSEEMFSVWYSTSPADPEPTSGTQPLFSPYLAVNHLDRV